VAVAAFRISRLGFLDIAAVVEEALASFDGGAARDLEELSEADAAARRIVQGALAAA
jgi:1-deoxy-D-xylulose-5-phosphate reductoisomerase